MNEKKLVEERNEAITRCEEIVNTAENEERALTEEEVKEFNELKAKVESIDKTIEAQNEVRAMTLKETKEEKEEKMEEVKEENVRSLDNGMDAHEVEVFAEYLRNTANGLETRAGEITPSANSAGALIPTTIVNYIIRKVYDICPILERSQRFNVKGKLEVPFYPADSNHITVAYQDEFTDLTSSSGKFDTITLTGFLAGALTKISRSLINNVDFDIVGFVVDQMAEDIARFIEGELLNGTTNKVEGLSGLTNGITAAAATAITADEIIRLHDTIKDRFQGNAMWIMSPATRTALRTLKSNTGYYLLNDDMTSPFGSVLLGKPVYVSDNMPDMAAGKVAIYYGDMNGLATKFNEDISIDVLRELFATQHAYGVVAWFEFDAKVIDEQQIAKLTMAA